MSSTRYNFKKIINRLILFIGLGVFAHIIFVLSTTEKSLILYLNKLSPGHILLIILLMLYPWVSYAARVVMWSRFLKEKLSYADALRVVITADLASALSPTAVGGAPVKAALLINRGFSPGSVGFMLTYGVIEDIIFYITGIVLAGFFSAGLLSQIGQELSDFFNAYAWQIIVIVAVLSTYFLMLYHKKIPSRYRIWVYLPEKMRTRIFQFRTKMSQSFKEMSSNFTHALKNGKLKMVLSMLMLYIQWLSKFSVLIVILHAFNIDFNTIQIYVRQWVIYVTMLFIPTPGASGGAEASFLLIFGKSIPSDITYLVVSLWRLFTYYFLLVAAVIFYSLLSYFLRKEEDLVIETQD